MPTDYTELYVEEAVDRLKARLPDAIDDANAGALAAGIETVLAHPDPDVGYSDGTHDAISAYPFVEVSIPGDELLPARLEADQADAIFNIIARGWVQDFGLSTSVLHALSRRLAFAITSVLRHRDAFGTMRPNVRAIRRQWGIDVATGTVEHGTTGCVIFVELEDIVPLV